MQEQIRAAIARIEGKLVDGGSTRGTGCLVTENLVLTALHVAAYRESQTLAPKAAEFDLIFPHVTVKATICDQYWDRDSDWVLLKCATPPGIRPLPLGLLRQDGATWETFGFPDSNPIDGLALFDGTVHDCQATHRLPDTGGAVNVMQVFSATVAQMRIEGLSGAPVIVDGAVVGLLRYTPKSETGGSFGTIYACPVASVLGKTGDVLPLPDPCFGLPGFSRRDFPAQPFVSLHWFSEKEAEIFFGREQEIRRLYLHLTGEDGDPVVLVYGQSGVGKSSLLSAGLFPRLERYHEVRYLRRDAGSTLSDSVKASIGAGADVPLAQAWLDCEAKSGKPLILLMDQIDEVYTHPNRGALKEMEEFAEGIAKVFSATPRPRGRMALAFRKEWFSDVKKQLDASRICYALEFVQRLDRIEGKPDDGLIGAITGVAADARLAEHYGLQIDPGLADTMANDLLKDQDSPIAPTLQILLTNMWLAAAKESASAPRITLQHYLAANREGNLLGHFLGDQLAGLSDPAWVQSGLALDVLAFHTSLLMTAQERTADELWLNFGNRADALVEDLKRQFLLTDSSPDNERKATRLCHDTLAPLVRLMYHKSLRPGQRARRILENRVENWNAGSASGLLDGPLIELVDAGRPGMRNLTKTEDALLEASRVAERKRAFRQRLIWRLGAAMVAAIVVIAGIALKEWSSAVKQRNLREVDFAVDSSSKFISADPGKALMLAIAAVGRSVELNGDVTPPVEAALAYAVQEAREMNLVNLPAGAQGPYGIAYSSAGMIATGGDAIRLFDRYGRPQGGFFGKPDSGHTIRAVAFSPDGKTLATSDDNGEIRLWDTTGNAIGTGFGAGGGMRGIAFTPEGDRIVSNSVDGMLTLWDLQGKQQWQTAVTTQPQSWTNQPVEHKVDTVRTPRGEDYIVAAAEEGQVGVWQLDGKRVGTLTAKGNVVSVAAALFNGEVWMTTGGSEGTGKTWRPAVRAASNITDVAVSRGANLSVTALGSSIVQVRAIGSEANLWRFRTRNNDCCKVAVHPKAAEFALLDEEPALQIMEIETRLEKQTLNDTGAVAFSPKTDVLAVAGAKSVDVWTLKDGKMQPTSRIALPDQTAIRSIAFSSDGTGLAGVTSAGAILVWNRAGVQKAQLQMAGEAALPGWGLRFSKDGTQILSAAANGLVLWDLKSQTGKPVLANVLKDAEALALRHDAGAVAMEGTDHRVRIVDLSGKDQVPALQFSDVLQSMAFSEDGQKLVTVDSGGDVKVWTLTGPQTAAKAGPTMKTLNGKLPTRAVFGPNGDAVFIAAQAFTMRSASDGTQIVSYPFGANIGSFAVSPDGKLIAGSAPNGVRIWPGDWHDWLEIGCKRIEYHSMFTDKSQQDDFDRDDVPYAAKTCQAYWGK